MLWFIRLPVALMVFLDLTVLCAQVLKREAGTGRVRLAMASIPALDGAVFPGPKGTVLLTQVILKL